MSIELEHAKQMLAQLKATADSAMRAIEAFEAAKTSPVDIEAGALACSQWVYGSNHGKPSWDRLSEDHRNEYREQAKACARAWGLVEAVKAPEQEAGELTDLDRQEAAVEIYHQIAKVAGIACASTAGPAILTALLERFELRRR